MPYNLDISQNQVIKPAVNVLVTGATGMVGSYLTAALLKKGGYRVRVAIRNKATLDRLEFILKRYGYDLNMIEIMEAQIEDYAETGNAIKGCDIVFHCAAKVSMGHAEDDRLVADNVGMTHNVVMNCLEDPARPLMVHISSVAALGQALPGTKITEEAIFGNIAAASPYARSKFLSENEVWRGIGMGLNAVIVNPSVILGSVLSGGEIQTVINFAARKGIKWYTRGVSGYVDVRDVADAMIVLSRMPETWGRRYILSGYDLSVRDLVGLFNRAFGHPQPKFRIRMWMIALGQKLINLWRAISRDQTLTYDLRDLLLKDRYYDGSYIRRVTGFEYRTPEETAELLRGIKFG